MTTQTAPGSSRESHPGSEAAWREYLEHLERARERVLSSRWATSAVERAQGAYYVQMLNSFGFNMYLAPRQAYPHFYTQTIFMPFESSFGAPCPDFHYRWTFLDGSRTYRIRAKAGTTRWVEFQAQRGFWGDADQRRMGNWDLDAFQPGADGWCEIVASSDQQSGNWIPLDADVRNVVVLVREALWDWANDRVAELSIEDVTPRARGPIAHSQDEMDRRLLANGRLVTFAVDFFLQLNDRILEQAGGTNAFAAERAHTSDNVGGNPRAGYVHMIYDLQPDESLVVETELPNARYWGLQLADPWWQTTDYTYHHASLNGHQARTDADGKVRIVIGAQDPGVPNWLDTVDNPRGVAMWRWYLSDRMVVPTVRKMHTADVRAALPADTPVVTVEERRRVVAARAATVRKRLGI